MALKAVSLKAAAGRPHYRRSRTTAAPRKRTALLLFSHHGSLTIPVVSESDARLATSAGGGGNNGAGGNSGGGDRRPRRDGDGNDGNGGRRHGATAAAALGAAALLAAAHGGDGNNTVAPVWCSALALPLSAPLIPLLRWDHSAPVLVSSPASAPSAPRGVALSPLRRAAGAGLTTDDASDDFVLPGPSQLTRHEVLLYAPPQYRVRETIYIH